MQGRRSDAGAVLAMKATYNLLSHGRPLAALEHEADFLRISAHPDFTKRHFSRRAASELSDAICKVIVDAARADIDEAFVAALSCDEVTTSNRQSRSSMHFYYCKNFKRYHVMIGLPEVLSAPNAANLRDLIVETIFDRLGVSIFALGGKLVLFSSDGASVLAGHLTGVGVQLIADAPFAIHMTCRSHGVNLVGNSAMKEAALQTATATAVAPVTYYVGATHA